MAEMSNLLPCYATGDMSLSTLSNIFIMYCVVMIVVKINRDKTADIVVLLRLLLSINCNHATTVGVFTKLCTIIMQVLPDV
jgi:hypothetical protein